MLASHPIRTDEMAYLALRSLIGLSWDEPQSESDIRRAAAYEGALEMVLTQVSLSVAPALARPEALLPYWGRLGFLRVMMTIPEEQVEAQRLHRFACVLLKDPVFNARSFQHEDYGLVGLNFALEPILKFLNRMLLHYFHTRDMAGPQRLERAWASLVPIAAYFWACAAVPVNRLTPFYVMFDSAMVMDAQALTASQVDFIIRHELGHLVLDHARRLRAVSDGAEASALRHEFEFAADAFAYVSLRSALYNRLRCSLQWVREPVCAADTDSKGLEALENYQKEVSGVRLLFMYMNVVDEIGQMLNRRLGNTIRFRQHLMDSHPPPWQRLARLDTFHVGEFAPTSQVVRYAENFFSDILAYANSLDDAALAGPLRGLF